MIILIIQKADQCLLLTIKMKLYRKVKLNECKECYHQLVLVEQETIFSDLSDNGLPINTSIANEVIVRLICPNCGAVYEAEKVGPAYHIAPIIKYNRKPKEIHYDNPFLLEEEN